MGFISCGDKDGFRKSSHVYVMIVMIAFASWVFVAITIVNLATYIWSISVSIILLCLWYCLVESKPTERFLDCIVPKMAIKWKELGV